MAALYILIIASVGYFCISLISSIQLFRILLHGHKIKSLACYFLSLCLLWSTIRAFYFALGGVHEPHLSHTSYYVLFGVPIILQYATFSLILVYYEEHIGGIRGCTLGLYLSAILTLTLTVCLPLLLIHTDRLLRH